MTVTPGEDSPDIGRDGLYEAKRWLEMSTRVLESWTHRDTPLRELLGFGWPNGSGTFTFDMGGRFRGELLHKQSFMAEIKNYKAEQDLPALYRDFVAKCYVAFKDKPDRCGHFLWLSWAPFQAQSWDKHTAVPTLKKHLLHKSNLERVFGTTDRAQAELAIDPEVIVEVSNRIWLLTLSHKQEQLVLTKDHYAEVLRMILAEAV